MHTPLKIKNVCHCLPYPWHPSVVFAESGWNGHKFWMAQTPYPPYEVKPYRDYYELPCIHYSDDGIHWHPIPGNPIEVLTEEEIEAHNYYSDPHLVLKDGVLELFYRYTILKDRQLIGNKTVLLRRTSVDGHNWSDREIIADLRVKEDVMIWGEQIVSQAIVWNDGKYRCYYVDRSSYLKDRKILRTTSVDGRTWQPYSEVELLGCVLDPWHIDVQYYEDKYQMIVYDMDKIFWFESKDSLHFQFISEILRPSSNRYDFYADGLYRACSVKTRDEILVYFSAKRKKNTYLGLLSTYDRHRFIPVNGVPVIKWLPVVWKSLIKSFLR